MEANEKNLTVGSHPHADASVSSASRSTSAVSARYRNPWFSPMHGHDPEFYVTDAKPVEWRGVFVYQRLKGICWDYVKDGVCLTQRAGASRYREVIDELLAVRS
jgi:hypothetical protein